MQCAERVALHIEKVCELIRRVPDIRSVIVNLDRYHTTNRPAAHANEKGPLTGGCPISSMVTVNIYVQHLYRELNFCILMGSNPDPYTGCPNSKWTF